MDPSFERARQKIPVQLRERPGTRFTVIINGEKKPEGKDWSGPNGANYAIDDAPLAGYLSQGHNYGVLCGHAGITVVDIDDPAALEELGIMQRIPSIMQVKTGRGGKHVYFDCPELDHQIGLYHPTRKDADGEPLHLGEIQSKGQQVLGPGSIHPNGNRYELVDDAPILKISKADLLKIFDGLILTGIDDPAEEPRRSAERRSRVGGSSLGDLINIDAVAWPKNIKEQHGSEVIGTHPLHGSKNGKNFSVNTAKNCWHCFHGGHNSGGGPLEWIAVEAGLIRCEDAKPGCLDDKTLFKKVLQIARDRGFDIPAPNYPKELWEATPEEQEALYNAVMDGLKPGMSQEEFDKFKMPEGPRLTVNLPPDNFITRFMAYGEAVCDAYIEYWFMGALFALAVVSDKKVKYDLSAGTVFTNVYIYLLGLSTLARKSTVVVLTENMLLKVLGCLLADSRVPTEFSSESFIEHMDHYNHAAWVRDEAAGVISIMKKDYMKGFKETLMQLYDSRRITRKLRTSERKNVQKFFDIVDPFLNLFFASTDAALGMNMEPVDTQSGFLARFLFAFPQHENPNYMPLCKGNAKQSEMEDVCRNQLAGIAALMADLPECVDMNNSPEAQEYWAAWGESRERAMAKIKDGYSSQIMGRLNTTVLKFAMLFELATPGFNPTNPIRLEYIVEACRLMDTYFLPTTRAVYDLVSNQDKQNHIAHMVGYLKRNGGRATRKAIMRDEKIKSKEMTEYLLTMQECDLITIENVWSDVTKRNTAWIFLVDNQEVAKIEEVVIVGKVGKVDRDNNRATTIETLPTLLPFPTLEKLEDSSAFSRVECKDVSEKEAASSPAPTIGPHPRKDDPGRERFKAGLAAHRARHDKHTCRLCEEHFEIPLTIWYHGGGYMCERCRRDGAPSEPIKADPQTTLPKVEA